MNSSYKSAWLFRIGILVLLMQCNFTITNAQCDFINDITGLSLSTPPAGNAANPALYTQVYVLVDENGNIFATNTTPDFTTVLAGSYNLYGVNYDNTENPTVLPLLAVGQPWIAIENYGNNVANCLDFTTAYGSGCPIVVCEEMTICEIDTLTSPALNFAVTDYTQRYCLVCADQVEDVNTTGVFSLLDYTAAAAGANCQLYAVNYNTTGTFPIAAGATWSTTVAPWCNDECFDFIGMNLDITAITQASGNGVSTTLDWTNGSGCAGAQPAVNGGNAFSETVNNLCVPSYTPSPINAKPVAGINPIMPDDLTELMGGKPVSQRAPCVGTMDLTQNTIFYTVECAPAGPSQLDVLVSNAGPGITGVAAALYGPVNAVCPTITGGSFVDCNDAGTNSNSGAPMGDITLSTNGNPGEVYLVIVDTEGKDQFTISSNIIILSNKLVSFTGDKVEENNVLNWEVEEEKNVDKYLLERSMDGIAFGAVTEIAALNNGTFTTQYTYTDVLPGMGTRYYRLKTINIDGTVEISNTVVLSRAADNLGTVNVFPNPTKGTFYVEFSADRTANLEFEIQDMISQTIKQGAREVEVGMNRLELDIDGFPTATYIVSLTMNGQRVQRKLIKR